jgi:hypothetical protein
VTAAADAPALPNHHPDWVGPKHARRLDPATLNLITTQAREVRPGHALLTLLGTLLFAVGWVIAKSFGVAWLSGAWCYTAVRMGWRQARGEPLAQPDINQVLAENAQLREAVRRLGG